MTSEVRSSRQPQRAEPVVIGAGDQFELPDLLPGFGFPIGELWPE